MESLRVQTSSRIEDLGHAAIVYGEYDPGTYVTEAPVWFGPAEVFLGDLDPYQKELLEFSPAPMREFSSFDEFVRMERAADDTMGTINFLRYFQPEGTVATITKKPSPPYDRLCVVAPDRVAYLEAVIDYQQIGSFADMDEKTLQEVYETYRIASHLVSYEDARRSEEGGIDQDLLIR